MVLTPQEVIIVGSGASISPQISALQPILTHRFSIICNYGFKHFNGTFLAFLDKNFYLPEYAKHYDVSLTARHPDIYDELKQQPLIVGINHNGLEEFKLPNTILLPSINRANLTGIFALKILDLLNFKGTVYLLGFDWNRRIGLPEKDPNYNPHSDLKIHYYDLKHKGSGYVGFYEGHNPNNEFKPWINKKDVTIYNVSLESNINCFNKISYEQFYNLLSDKKENQEELQNQIKHLLLSL